MRLWKRSWDRSFSRIWYLHLRRYALPAQIIVEVCGGLGNQIWRWAFGQAVAARSLTDVTYDLTFYKKQAMDINGRERRDFGLLKTFPGLDLPVCPPEDALVSRRCTFKALADQFAFYESELSNPEPRWSVAAHWNLDYLRAVPEKAWERLVFAQNVPERAEKFAGYIDSEPAAVAVHIRRGDYVGTSFDILKPAYYYRAIDEFKARLSPLTPVFFVFSDENEWARGIFASRPERFVYADNGDDDAPLDMTLMARCRHFIIANSTFSFFGAYLSRKDPDNKIAVAPFSSGSIQSTLFNGLSGSEFPRLIKIPAAG